MTIQAYLEKVNQRHKSGISREHSYRGDLELLLNTIAPDVLITNEPARVACGAPDYIITKGQIPLGYIEAKDLGADLGSKSYKEQFDRYRNSLSNLIITDYLDFWLYRDGELVTTIEIASLKGDTVIPKPENFEQFTELIKDFTTHVSQTITSPKKLAEMMAGKAKMLALVIQKAIEADEKGESKEQFQDANNTLREQLSAFQSILIHDIQAKEFADIYAQTIAYGMFAARLHDQTLDDFSRQEAAELIPKSNPFLRKLFQYIAGYDLDNRIVWIVDALADIFRATDVASLLMNFGKATQQNDPIIHFYETFLAEYDPKLRKSRGVWYTPEPVVSFMVRAVDDILKTEFGLADGLADTSKTTIEVDSQVEDLRSKTGYKREKKEVHKVQILDPACGTGTFLSEVVKYIYSNHFEGQQGIWNQYVDQHLKPRLNGFELLMASYAMAHLKLDLLLQETGYKPVSNATQRLRVYLTNSLEEHHQDTGTLFANWLSTEANEANHIKRDTPVMVVIGNPPYSGESSNKGDWIMGLMEDYKREPQSKEKLQERTSKWINDDYVKFLRYSQHLINKTGEGVIAFINNHGFLDNPTFRGVRWKLLESFDEIYILDLHGNLKKKEANPAGGKDENVFDIQPGVSINFFVKKSGEGSKNLATVNHYDLYGLRKDKYSFLKEKRFFEVEFEELSARPPMFFFVKKDLNAQIRYDQFFGLDDLFKLSGVGLTTAHDDFVIDNAKDILISRFNEFRNLPRNADLLHSTFNVKKKKGWDILDGYDNLNRIEDLEQLIERIAYRPFDNRFIFYEDKLVWRTVRKVMHNYVHKDNIGLVIGRQGHVVGSMQWNLCFVTKRMTDFNFFYRGGGKSFPIYNYSQDLDGSQIDRELRRSPNFHSEVINKISRGIGIPFSAEQNGAHDSFSPIDIFNYIYSVLHSPSFREDFKEFLKFDFPRIPFPKDDYTFWELVELGDQLRQIHLMEGLVINKFVSTYPQQGSNEVIRSIGKKDFELTDKEKGLGRIWINDEQYFDGVPVTAWEFYIGGYQPAQKWLKDRKGKQLSFEDIRHYQKIIVALMETDRLMKEIDKVDFL